MNSQEEELSGNRKVVDALDQQLSELLERTGSSVAQDVTGVISPCYSHDTEPRYFARVYLKKAYQEGGFLGLNFPYIPNDNSHTGRMALCQDLSEHLGTEGVSDITFQDLQDSPRLRL